MMMIDFDMSISYDDHIAHSFMGTAIGDGKRIVVHFLRVTFFSNRNITFTFIGNKLICPFL